MICVRICCFVQVALDCDGNHLAHRPPHRAHLIRNIISSVHKYISRWPFLQRYIESFAGGFADNLRGVNVLFMQSDGGLTPVDAFNGECDDFPIMCTHAK